MAAEHAHAVPRVLRKGLEMGKATAISHRLLHAVDAAEFDERGAPCIVVRHPGAHVFVDLKLQVALELGGEIRIAMADADRSGGSDDPGAKAAERGHGCSGARNRARMSVVRAHSRASLS